MTPISTRYSVDYTKVSKLSFEGEQPDYVSDVVYFDTDTEAKAFINKLLASNDFWETAYCSLNIVETYR